MNEQTQRAPLDQDAFVAALIADRDQLSAERDQLKRDVENLEPARLVALKASFLRMETMQLVVVAQLKTLCVLPEEFRADAALSNDPKSPSIYVDCAERLEAALDFDQELFGKLERAQSHGELLQRLTILHHKLSRSPSTCCCAALLGEALYNDAPKPASEAP